MKQNDEEKSRYGCIGPSILAVLCAMMVGCSLFNSGAPSVTTTTTTVKDGVTTTVVTQPRDAFQETLNDMMKGELPR